jgi:hypothetical protein
MAIYLYNVYAVEHVILPDGTASTVLLTTMLVLGLTYTGVMLLAKTCEPFDMSRTVLVLSVISLTLIGVFLLAKSFGIDRSAMSRQDLFYMFIVVLSSYFVASVLMKLMRAMKVLN